MLPFEDENAVKEPELPLPDGKMSFTPEELYRYTRIKPFVLRFWESEFPSLKPQQTGSEGLAYSRADVEMILVIKNLLYVEGLTLVGARCRISGEEEAPPAKAERKAAKKKTKTPKKSPPAGSSPSGAAVGAARGPVKRGLPVDGASRSRVSLEELLPGKVASTGAPAAGPPGKAKKAPAKKKVAPATGPPVLDTDTAAPVLRRKLSAVLQELREILTFLHKGDR